MITADDTLKSIPVRIKRSRQHKMVSPNGLPIVYVGRPSKWGNPNRIVNGNRELAVELYRAMFIVFQDNPGVRSMVKHNIEEVKKELKGKNLACWCPLDEPCHADVLLEIANKP